MTPTGRRESKRRDHNRLGLAVQIAVARFLRRFLAVRVLIEATGDQVDVATGEVLTPAPASVQEVRAAIEAVVPRQQLTAALEAIIELTPPTDSDADESWRAMLVGRFTMVRPFLPRLYEVIQFGATAEGRPVLAALRTLPASMDASASPGRDRHFAAGRVTAAPGAAAAAPARRAGG